ncbi:MAG: Na(+)-translocating NADH-quinone reductase subunit A [Alistipes sp.]|nr:Na(+)-translocating NADH-quinone reductase subunit A [Alistipes sp.]
MSKIIKLRKGLDINLQGQAAEVTVDTPLAGEYAVSPLDFENVTPKLLVKVGDKVKAGTPLFFDKNNTRVLYCSPVSGTVSAVNRGEKRKILNVTVAADKEQVSEEFAVLDLKKASREDVIETLLKSGLWTTILQRPYGIVANPADQPKAVFVSAFDSAPLAPNMNYVLKGEQQNLQKGMEVLAKLAGGNVNLSVRAKAEGEMPALKNVTLHTFEGKHPVGNVGVQIHNIDPISKGEIVWTVNIQDVAAIGRLFATGKVDLHKVVALTGSEVEKPQYYRIISGAPIASIVAGQIKKQAEGDSVRIISGNVLTGKKVSEDGFITATASQITIIPEGDKYEMFGWIAPRTHKFSVSRSYFSWLCPKKQYKLDTNLNGGVRAFVVTGLFEEYLPMDIYPMYLFKAIMANDIDKMENLGIYEIVEEDVALCEFVDPSKTEIQQLVRDGINLMIKEC